MAEEDEQEILRADEEEENSVSSESSQSNQVKVFRRRWYILAVFSLLGVYQARIF